MNIDRIKDDYNKGKITEAEAKMRIIDILIKEAEADLLSGIITEAEYIEITGDMFKHNYN